MHFSIYTIIYSKKCTKNRQNKKEVLVCPHSMGPTIDWEMKGRKLRLQVLREKLLPNEGALYRLIYLGEFIGSKKIKTLLTCEIKFLKRKILSNMFV